MRCILFWSWGWGSVWADCVHVSGVCRAMPCLFYSPMSWSGRGLEVIAPLVPLSLSSSTTLNLSLEGRETNANAGFRSRAKSLYLSISPPFSLLLSIPPTTHYHPPAASLTLITCHHVRFILQCKASPCRKEQGHSLYLFFLCSFFLLTCT